MVQLSFVTRPHRYAIDLPDYPLYSGVTVAQRYEEKADLDVQVQIMPHLQETI